MGPESESCRRNTTAVGELAKGYVRRDGDSLREVAEVCQLTMPNWNTNERGQNREEESGPYEDSDWDGLSCMDHHLLPDRGPYIEWGWK